jgi:hypothetical protein
MEAWHLLWDFRVLKDLARKWPADSRLGSKAMYVANEIMNVFRSDDLSTISKARKVAEEIFGQGWQDKGADVYEEDNDKAPIWAISNCHIDTAWLWPFSVTQQKTARSWSTYVSVNWPECVKEADQSSTDNVTSWSDILSTALSRVRLSSLSGWKSSILRYSMSSKA